MNGKYTCAYCDTNYETFIENCKNCGSNEIVESNKSTKQILKDSSTFHESMVWVLLGRPKPTHTIIDE